MLEPVNDETHQTADMMCEAVERHAQSTSAALRWISCGIKPKSFHLGDIKYHVERRHEGRCISLFRVEDD